MPEIEQTIGQQMSTLIRARAGHAEPVEDEQTIETDFDGGARESAPGPVSMDRLIRRAAGIIRM